MTIICTFNTEETLTFCKVKTDRGTTFVIPRKCGQADGKCTCMLQNSELVRRVANGHKVLATRYINDSARPVLLVEVG